MGTVTVNSGGGGTVTVDASVPADSLSITITGELQMPIPVTLLTRYGFIDSTGGTTTGVTGKGTGVAISYSEIVPSANYATYYKSLLSISFNDLAFVNGGFSISACPKLTSVSAPELVMTQAQCIVSTSPLLTSINFAKLKYANGGFGLSTLPLLTTFDLPELVYCGTIPSYQFQVLTMAALTSFTAPKLKYIAGAASFTSDTALTSINLPELLYMGGNFTTTGSTALQTISFPKLTYCGGSFAPSGLATITSIDIHSLQHVQNSFAISGMTNAAFTSVDLSALVDVTNSVTISNCPNLIVVSMPALQNVYTLTSSSVINTTMTALTTISMPNVINTCGWTCNSDAALTTTTGMFTVGTLKQCGSSMAFASCALTQASVDHLLEVMSSLDGTGGTTLWGSGKSFNTSGGTSAAPSGSATTQTKAGTAFVGVTTTCTVTWVGHGYNTNNLLTITGITTLTNANGTFRITRDTADQFHYTIASQSATGGGTATVKTYGTTTGQYYKQKIIVNGATATTN